MSQIRAARAVVAGSLGIYFSSGYKEIHKIQKVRGQENILCVALPEVSAQRGVISFLVSSLVFGG